MRRNRKRGRATAQPRNREERKKGREATLLEDYHKHSTRSCMHVSAPLANTRVNPVFQLLFHLLHLHWRPPLSPPPCRRGPLALARPTSLRSPTSLPLVASFMPFPWSSIRRATSQCSCRCTNESAKRSSGISRSRDFHAHPAIFVSLPLFQLPNNVLQCSADLAQCYIPIPNQFSYCYLLEKKVEDIFSLYYPSIIVIRNIILSSGKESQIFNVSISLNRALVQNQSTSISMNTEQNSAVGCHLNGVRKSIQFYGGVKADRATYLTSTDHRAEEEKNGIEMSVILGKSCVSSLAQPRSVYWIQSRGLFTIYFPGKALSARKRENTKAHDERQPVGPRTGETPLRVHRERDIKAGEMNVLSAERSIHRINNRVCAREPVCAPLRLVFSLKKRSYATVSHRAAVGFLDLEQTIGRNRARAFPSCGHDICFFG